MGTGVLSSSQVMLRPAPKVTGSTHSSFLSGNSLRSPSHQCSALNATRQVSTSCDRVTKAFCLPASVGKTRLPDFDCALQIVSMSRYRGPRLRIVRRLGELPGLTQKTAKSQAPPGQHGATAKKPTQYGVRLMEKQKLRYNYGVTEHQLVNYVKKARCVANGQSKDATLLCDIYI